MHRANPIHEMKVPDVNTGWSWASDKIIVDIKTDYGYTPLKIGTHYEFSGQRAYDLWIEGYSVPGSKCYDIYPADEQSRYCLAHVDDGINIKGFRYNPNETNEYMAEKTRQEGALFINNLDLAILLNRVRRITKEK